MTDDTGPAWVLGGGGVAGIAWETGILAGLADEGVAVGPLGSVIGTSAGAIVGAQVTSGLPITEFYDRQIANNPREISPNLRASALWRLATSGLFARDAEHAGRRIGRAALAADIADPGLLLRITADRLPVHEWPTADLRVTAVDARSGKFRVFTRADGVPLVEAVAASASVPLSSSPVVINGRPYIDGGMRSVLNLDLAPGTGLVVALAPSNASLGRWARLPAQRAALGGRDVVLITRDEASRAAQGRSIMDRSVVPALAAAGRAQGRLEAARVKAALGV